MAALHRPALPAPRTLGKRISGKTVFIAAAVLAAGAAILQVNQLSRATSTGYEIDALSRERAAKQAENHELEAQVAQLSSLGRVEWDARTRLHLVPAERRLFITVNQPVPDRQMLPTRFMPPQPAAPAVKPSHRSFWKRVLGLIPFR